MNCKCGKTGLYRITNSDEVFCADHQEDAARLQARAHRAASARREANRDKANSRLGALNHQQGLGPRTHKTTY